MPSASRAQASRIGPRPIGAVMRLEVARLAAAAGAGEVHEALFAAVVGRTGVAGERDRDVGGRAGERAFGHRQRAGLGDRAVAGEDRLADAEQLALGLVGVDDEAALEGVRAAFDVGQHRGDEPAGAALGGGEPEPEVAGAREHPPDRVLHVPGQVDRLGLGHGAFLTARLSYVGAPPAPQAQRCGNPEDPGCVALGLKGGEEWPDAHDTPRDLSAAAHPRLRLPRRRGLGALSGGARGQPRLSVAGLRRPSRQHPRLRRHRPVAAEPGARHGARTSMRWRRRSGRRGSG